MMMNTNLVRPNMTISPINMSLRLKKAREFAIEAHGDQILSDGKPYSVHLDLVVNWLAHFKYFNVDDHQEVFIAAYLHDVVEDTKITLDEIEARFGSKVRNLVWRMTDEPGQNRKERKLNTYPKITGIAEALKLADRITNVTYSDDPKYKQMYRQEQPEFERMCRKCYPDMWNFLNQQLAS